jgi:NhaA family Na+:H+ antiporter
MVDPAYIYLADNAGTDTARGWGIPMATDIALAVGVLALAGSRVHPSLRLFLLALAVVDDIGAIIVIAVFYSSGVSATWLLLGAVTVGAMVVLRRFGVAAIWPYVICGTALWLALHEAHIHPTIAGVICGLLAPAVGPLAVVERLEHALHSWSSFLVVPLFALANAGVSLGTSGFVDRVTSPASMGIIAGLVLGKPLGILLFSRLATATGLARLPNGVRWVQVLAAGAVAGIGFTVAIFIAGLAFADPVVVEEAKLAILLASLSAGAIGFIALGRTSAGRSTEDEALTSDRAG